MWPPCDNQDWPGKLPTNCLKVDLFIAQVNAILASSSAILVNQTAVLEYPVIESHPPLWKAYSSEDSSDAIDPTLRGSIDRLPGGSTTVSTVSLKLGESPEYVLPQSVAETITNHRKRRTFL